MVSTPTASELRDNPAYAALSGPHAVFARSAGRALRYDPEVSPWLGAPPDMTDQDWREAAAAVPPTTICGVIGAGTRALSGWRVLQQFDVVQMAETAAEGFAEPDAVELTAADVPEMLKLVALTRPGPFVERTIEMGSYLGIRWEGALAAMAGERLHLPGYTEISAVCTHPEARGQGFATRLTRAILGEIHDRGERAFLHAMPDNPAIRVYAAIGFAIRRTLTISVVTPE